MHTSCTGCHFVVIDIEGNAWLFGRNGSSCLGVEGPEYISENAPRLVRATDLGAAKGTTFVHAACGRNHTVLVGSDGTVWAAGENKLGQVGQIPFMCSTQSYFNPVWSKCLSRNLSVYTSEHHPWGSQGEHCEGFSGCDFFHCFERKR